MKLKEAQAIANEVSRKLSPYCERIETAGSIRRQKPEVRDIDIVLVPSKLWDLNQAILNLGPSHVAGEKLKRVNYNGKQIDIYYATENTWVTLLLIRTGSTENNIRLCKRARSLGMKLKANGDGIIGKDGQLIKIESEEQIYSILKLPYQKPGER